MKKTIAILLAFAALACFITGCTGVKEPTEITQPPVTREPAQTEPAQTEPAQTGEITLTASNFDEYINGDTPILVDFWASWCGPCMLLAPIVEEIANESDGSYRVGKVNVDEQPALTERFEISAIPQLYVFKNGEIVESYTGLTDKATLMELIESAKLR